MVFDPIWETIFKKSEWGKYPGEDLIRFIARNYYGVPDRGALKILEVGCGPGANLWYIAREGFQVYGIDGSETAIKRAISRLDTECPHWSGSLRKGDIKNLEFNANFFDAVIDNEAIYANSFEDSVQIFKELFRVTKQRGKIFSRTFAKGSYGDNTGTSVGHNAWIVSEGPLLDKGFSRFTEYSEISLLLGDFHINEVELLTRTVNGRSHEIKEWIIIGEKPGANK